MPNETHIIVQNKLNKEKRSLNVYHHAGRAAYIISDNSSLTLPVNSEAEEDYLDIAIQREPGNLWVDNLIDLPLWAEFEFSTEGKVTVTRLGERTILNIPPGPPIWRIKITWAIEALNNQTQNTIMVSDGMHKKKQ